MNELCGMDCCARCTLRGGACAGCAETGGHPCGTGTCTAAECVRSGGSEAMAAQRQAILDEVNALGIPGLEVTALYPLIGAYVNLAYPLPNGEQVKLLRDDRVYWGSQVEQPAGGRCWGLVADVKTLIVCSYGENGADPELLLWKKRG